MKQCKALICRAYRFVRRNLIRLSGYHVSLYAANAAFYIILSVFPAILLLVCLLPLIGYTSQDLLVLLDGVVPEVVLPLLERVLNDMSVNSSGLLLSVSALVAIWSSSRGVYCIQLGLNAIYGVRESRNYILRRLISMLYMVLIIVALLLTLVLHGFGQELAAYLSGKSIPILHFLAQLMQFRGLILVLLLTGLFTAVLSVFPNRKISPKRAFPGAALASLGWLMFTRFFSVYVRMSGSYSLLYGSLSIIAITMLWLFVCMSILFYAAVFNIRFERWLGTQKK